MAFSPMELGWNETSAQRDPLTSFAMMLPSGIDWSSSCRELSAMIFSSMLRSFALWHNSLLDVSHILAFRGGAVEE